MDQLSIPVIDDFHVHVRQGEMLRQVAPLIRTGGVGRCNAMPNTQPPLVSVAAVESYCAELQAAAPAVRFYASLYLSPELTSEEIQRGAESDCILAVKCYPRGVTTNSSSGVEDLAAYDRQFAAMEEAGLVLQLHGEVPSNTDLGIDVMNAEERFLPELCSLHERFPKLKIVLEHVSSSAAVECVRSLGDTVAATITWHHLELIVDDWAGKIHNFCKPVAKHVEDRQAVREAATSGDPRFFFGSDSAPHSRGTKETAAGRAGIFTTPVLVQGLVDCFDRLGCLDRVADFTSTFGRLFYELPPIDAPALILERRPMKIPAAYGDVVPFRAGQTLSWCLADKN